MYSIRILVAGSSSASGDVNHTNLTYVEHFRGVQVVYPGGLVFHKTSPEASPEPGWIWMKHEDGTYTHRKGLEAYDNQKDSFQLTNLFTLAQENGGLTIGQAIELGTLIRYLAICKGNNPDQTTSCRYLEDAPGNQY